MDQTWKTHIIILIAINFSEHILCFPLEDTADSVGYPVEYVYDNDELNNQLDKRLSSFVRIGRGLSSFIRIGKNDQNVGGYAIETGIGNDNDGEYQKRKSAFERIANGNEPEADKRLSSFVRIGKSDGDTYPYTTPLSKRGGAFIRLGKFPSAAFVRNRSGRIHSIASPPYYRRSGRIGHSSFIRIGKRDTSQAMKQTHAKELEDEQQSGYNYDQELDNKYPIAETMNDMRDEQEKRMSSFVRIGRQGSVYIPDAVYGQPAFDGIWPAAGAKRMSSFVRIGKDYNTDNLNKRMSSFVRIGKNYGENRFDKRRLSSFVRIGKSNNDDFPNADKRMSKFVRIGKAMEVPNEDIQEIEVPNEDFNGIEVKTEDFNAKENPNEEFSTMDNPNEEFNAIEVKNENLDAEKRRLSKFIRIGKDNGMLTEAVDQREQNPEKRMSSFVRIGKSNDDKRMSSFVRIGKSNDDKRMSSFVRIGKASGTQSDDAIQIDNNDLETDALNQKAE